MILTVIRFAELEIFLIQYLLALNHVLLNEKDRIVPNLKTSRE